MKIKRILSLVICLVMVLTMLSACKPTESESPNSDGTNGDTDRTVEQLPPGLYADLSTAITIKCPDKEEAYFNKYIPMLIRTIKSKTGVAISASTDFEKGNNSNEIKNDEYEILIGDTNRLETALTECPENSYVIKVVGKKVVIKGSSQYYTTMGLFYFMDNCIGKKADNQLFNIDTAYSFSDSPRNEASAFIDKLSPEAQAKTFKLFSSTGEANAFTATGKTFKGKVIALKKEKVLTYDKYLDSDGKRTLEHIQGGCTDGKYFYFLLTNPGDGAKGAANEDETRVIKVDPTTMQVVQVGPIISVAHSNDLTYDSKYDRLVVAWCSVDANTMSYIDMKTLTVKQSPSFSSKFFSIDYDASGNRFVFAGSNYASQGYPIIVAKGGATASVYQTIKTFKGISMGYIAQGIHCDSKYIYYTVSPNNASGTKGQIDNVNIINVYDYDGNYVCTLTIDLPDEIEHIFWYDNSFWAGFNANDGSKYLYKLSF